MVQFWRTVTSKLVTRKGAWAALALALLLVGALSGGLGKSSPPGAVNSLPASTESAQVKALQQQFPHSDLAPVMAVFTQTDGSTLTKTDLASVKSVGDRLAAQVGQKASPAVTSQDGRAALVSVLIKADRPNAEIATTIKALRSTVSSTAPQGMTVQITGGPAFGADIASAFDGANVKLLAVTIGIVALLLLLTYRSPVLWLVPLTVVGVADQVAGLVTGWMGQQWNLQFDAGIIGVLVFGAGTNYALLLISRYREELRHTDDHRAGLKKALRATAPAILASNITVVLSLLTLVFAVMPSTRGLGIASAAGLLVVLAFGLLVLPAALAVCGRNLFWPFIPRNGDVDPSTDGIWRRIATSVTKRPAVVVGISAGVILLLGSGLIGTKVGLSQTQQFRVSSQSAAGFETLAHHFPAGESEPMIVVAKTPSAGAVVKAASAVPGVVRANAAGASETGLTKILVIGSADPGTNASYQTVREVRAAVHQVAGADAVVGGQNAQNLDVKDASRRDLTVIAPMILALVFLILVVLLRALVAPALLVVVNTASALAAIGAGTWVGKTIFGFPALDVNVPLLAFLFLVALGIDYTIFLVHRAQQEARLHGTREGMVRAVSHTGAVITSAGVVLAAVFTALGILPLVTLGQLGLIVGLGVLIDTLFVRTILVPAVFALVGDRIWLPGKVGPEVRHQPQLRPVRELQHR